MQNSNKKCGQRYDREFKRDAVALVKSGRTITEVALDLGVSHWSLARWVKGVEAGQWAAFFAQSLTDHILPRRSG
jgi:transposase-like protein